MRARLSISLAGFLSVAGPAFAEQSALERQIDQALSAVEPAVQVAGRSYAPQTMTELMDRHDVPGASIVVFHDGRIVYERGFGFAEASEAEPVTPGTLFQAASISKPVAATGALALVDQGALDLDTPVNAKLRSWRIPDSATAQGESITLRHLLTHTAGLTVHGFPGYPAGTPLPTVAQVLDGAPPANTAAVRIDQQPGSTWRYSGGGFTVAQLLMADVSGEPFPGLMDRLVL